MTQAAHDIACRCGKVALSAVGAPIIHAACYCRSCREGGRLLGALPGASPVVGPDGGTDYLLFRKDRVQCVRGVEHLRELRLKPDSPTRRVAAGCCNSPMFLDFSKAHWVTVYRERMAGPVPPLQARIMTADKPQGVTLPDDVPQYKGYAGKMMVKLLGAWAAMGFRIPAVRGVPKQAPPVVDG